MPATVLAMNLLPIAGHSEGDSAKRKELSIQASSSPYSLRKKRAVLAPEYDWFAVPPDWSSGVAGFSGSSIPVACEKMELRSGIKLISEIEGYGDPIRDGDRCDAVLKFYRNQGDPLVMKSALTDAIPYVKEGAEGLEIAWEDPVMTDSHIVFERDLAVSRGADVLPGIYYTLLGMRVGGFRHVAIPPHLYAHSMHEVHGIERESVTKVECFVTAIR